MAAYRGCPGSLQPPTIFHTPDERGWGVLTQGGLAGRLVMNAGLGLLLVSILAFFEEIGWRAWLLLRLVKRVGVRNGGSGFCLDLGLLAHTLRIERHSPFRQHPSSGGGGTDAAGPHRCRDFSRLVVAADTQHLDACAGPWCPQQLGSIRVQVYGRPPEVEIWLLAAVNLSLLALGTFIWFRKFRVETS